MIELPGIEVAYDYVNPWGYVSRHFAAPELRTTADLSPQPGVYSLWLYRHCEDPSAGSTDELHWYYIGESGNVRARVLNEHFALKTDKGEKLYELLADEQSTAELRMIGKAKFRFASHEEWLPLDFGTSWHRELVEAAILVALEHDPLEASAANALRRRKGVPNPVLYEDDFPECFRSPRGNPGARYRDEDPDG